MSGDVQPRKRKDKSKKRKDDEDPVQIREKRSSSEHSPDIQMHIEKENETGGHWCAKIVFFALLSILIGLIALIIIENRGMTEVAQPQGESRFSEYFEGWVEEPRDDHDEEEHHHLEEEGHDDDDDGHGGDETHDDDGHEPEVYDEENLSAQEDEETVQASEEVLPEEDDDEQDTGDNGNANSQEQNAGNDDDEPDTNSQERETPNDDETPDENDDEDDNLSATPQELNLNDGDLPFEEDTTPDSTEQFFDNDAGEELFVKRLSEEKLAKSREATKSAEAEDTPEKSSVAVKIVVGITMLIVGVQVLVNKKPSGGNVYESTEKINESEVTNIQAFKHETIERYIAEQTPVIETDVVEQKLLLETTQVPFEKGETPIQEKETFDPLFDDDLNEANDNIENNPKKALKLFEKLLKYQPESKAALLGKANALNKLSVLYKDNNLLREAIQIYEKLLLDKNLMIEEDSLFEKIGVVCVDRMTFLGNFNRAIEVQKVLMDRFPEKVDHRNQLAIIYLMINRLSEAKQILHETLLKWRHNGVALVHYGFVLKQLDNDLEHAVIFLREGIESGENGTQEGLFYMNLGDALMRLGRTSEASEIYTEGSNRDLFLSPHQRSLYNIIRLKAQPFWTPEETTYESYLRTLRQHWRQILNEGVSALNLANGFTDESENLRDRGDWKQYEIYARGRRNINNCKNTPVTCDLVEKFPAAAGCKRGQVKYSVMLPGTHVWPHTGPTNCRLRAHLGLKVPSGTFLRVKDQTKSWKEGEWLIFDDSFEHEVWHNGTDTRLVLIVDIWHPEITEEERKILTPI